MWKWLRFRALRFRREAVVLAYAFTDPQTPSHLRLASLLSAIYLISPIDLIPITVPVLGLLDDLLLLPWVTGLIAERLPSNVRLRAGQKADQWLGRWFKWAIIVIVTILIALILFWAAMIWIIWSAIWGS